MKKRLNNMAKPKQTIINRLHNLPVKGLLKFSFSVIIAATFMWGSYHLVQYTTNQKNFPIQSIAIEGKFTHLTKEKVYASASEFLPANFFTLDVNQIREQLELIEWVDRAYVRKRWPDEISVRIEEQEVLSRWGADALLNSRGEMFSPGKDTFPKGLTVIEAPEQHRLLAAERFKQVQAILNERAIRLQRLVFDKRGAWSLQLGNEQWVYLGREAFNERFARVMKVYPGLFRDRIDQIVSMDFRYTNGFAVQWHSQTENDRTEGAES